MIFFTSRATDAEPGDAPICAGRLRFNRVSFLFWSASCRVSVSRSAAVLGSSERFHSKSTRPRSKRLRLTGTLR